MTSWSASPKLSMAFQLSFPSYAVFHLARSTGHVRSPWLKHSRTRVALYGTHSINSTVSRTFVLMCASHTVQEIDVYWLQRRISRAYGDSASIVFDSCMCASHTLQEIDAYWLQRRIGRAYGDSIDAPRAQQLAEEVLSSLAETSVDSRALENDLVLSLGFEQFELIKELLRNRLKIVWCTRLSRTQVW